jgi:gluconate 5-dehydrogenase
MEQAPLPADQPAVAKLFSLAGRTARVTGGSRGLGLAIAVALGQMGARVAVAARRAQWLQEAQQRLQREGIEAATFVADVTSPEQVAELVDQVARWGGGPHVAVCAAGVAWGAPSLEMPAEKVRWVLDVNVTDTYLVARECARRMKEQGYGKIVAVASVVAVIGQPAEVLDAVGYTASKGAIVAMVRDLAVKWAPWGIRVNALAPGYVPTRLSAAVIERSQKQLVAATPLGRLGTEADIQGAAVFLASPASDFITGQTLVVDGGMSAW